MISWSGSVGVLILTGWLAANDGGYFSKDFLTAAIMAWTLLGLLILLAWDEMRIPSSARLPVLLLALITALCGASAIWSISPNLSLQELARASIYLAGFLAVLMGPATVRSVRISTVLFVSLATGIAVFALLAKIIPSYSQDYTYSAGRLMGSLGYWNALAIFMVMAMLPCLWLSADPRTRRAGRLAATAALVLMAVTLFFTLSRGGILIGLVSIILFIVISPYRLGSIWSLLAAGIPSALLVAYTYSSLPSLHAAPAGSRIDPGEGRQFALLLAAAIVTAAILRFVTSALPDRLPPTRNSRLLAVAVVCFSLVLLAAAGLGQRDRVASWQEQANTPVTSAAESGTDTTGVGRLVATTDQRTELWHIGFTNFTEHPLLGTGGGTYRFANQRLQSGFGLARDPHSIWIRFLSDQGIAGFTVLIALMGSLAYLLLAPLARDANLRRDGLYISLVIAVFAWLADSSLEWNWELPAMGLAFFFLAALALRLGSSSKESDRESGTGAALTAFPVWLRMTVMTGGAILAIVFLSLLASSILNTNAGNDLSAGDPAAALVAANRAARLDPFSTDPLVIKSRVAAGSDNPQQAATELTKAIDLEPQRSTLYERLALIQFYDLKSTDDGIASLERAIELDPQFRALHLMLHRMTADAEIYQKTGQMPAPPEVAE